MKHIKYAALLAIFALASCQQEILEPVQESEHLYVTAGSGDFESRTVLQEDGSIFWNPKDSIGVYFGEYSLGKFVGLNETAKSYTVFMSEKTFVVGSLAGADYDYWGVYPYNKDVVASGNDVTLTVPSAQTAVPGSFDPKAFPSVGRSADQKIAFYNVCGGVKFSVGQEGIKSVEFSSNGGVSLAGKVRVEMESDGYPVASVIEGTPVVTLNAPDGESFIPGEWYYIALLPGQLTGGFGMTFYWDDHYARRVATSSPTVKRAVFGVLGIADDGAESIPANDLSAEESANSYIVPSAGFYKIKAVKGNTLELVGDVASAEVIWESFGTDVAPAAGDLISSVSYSDGDITFRASSRKGNALIAAKDASGNILWSWHIWLTDQPEGHVYKNGAGVLMDRNLGATSAEASDIHSLGLLYQWGRKDPFLSGGSFGSDKRAAVSGLGVSLVSASEETGNVAFATAHPTTFLIGSETTHDWRLNSDYSLWGVEKTMYDPCPAGWVVSELEDNSSWWVALGGPDAWSPTGYSNGHYGFDFPFSDAMPIQYPLAGRIIGDDGSLTRVGVSGYYYSAIPELTGNYPGYVLGLSYHASVDRVNHYSFAKSNGHSIRCVRVGSTENLAKASNLSADGTANSYIVSEPGMYKFKVVRGNSNQSVGNAATAEVLWETFGTDVSPMEGDLVRRVSYRDGYIYFYAKEAEGNALIAVKDASGNILWSWHIWMTDRPADQVYRNNAGIMMDRNLGATSTTPGDASSIGLLYQWGRKDPFLAGDGVSSPTKAASTCAYWGKVQAANIITDRNAEDYAIANPTTFIIKADAAPFDWNCLSSANQNNTLWAENKTIYDPCPPGYKIPSAGSSGIFHKAAGTKAMPAWNDTLKGCDFTGVFTASEKCWYPAAGQATYGGSESRTTGAGGYYWSYTVAATSSVYELLLESTRVETVMSSKYRSSGRSVRCRKID